MLLLFFNCNTASHLKYYYNQFYLWLPLKSFANFDIVLNSLWQEFKESLHSNSHAGILRPGICYSTVYGLSLWVAFEQELSGEGS